jgi:hypothetical protein
VPAPTANSRALGDRGPSAPLPAAELDADRIASGASSSSLPSSSAASACARPALPPPPPP